MSMTETAKSIARRQLSHMNGTVRFNRKYIDEHLEKGDIDSQDYVVLNQICSDIENMLVEIRGDVNV